MNRLACGLLATCAIGILCGSSLGQVTFPQNAPHNQSQQTQPATQPAFVWDTVIYKLDIPDGTSIEQMLALLKEKVPSFQYVVAPGAWQREKLPKMHLANFTLNSAFNLLRNLYPSTFQIAGINRPDEGGGEAIFSVGNFEDAEPVLVRAFSLSSAISVQSARDVLRGTTKSTDPTARKTAMSEVMSLIEATLNQSGEGTVKASISVHDATETLIVKASPPDLAVTEKTIAVLQSSLGGDEPWMNQMRSLQEELDHESRVSAALKHENEEMAQQLRAAKSSTRPADKN